MTDRTVIVDAVRTPIGRRQGGLSAMHPAGLLGRTQRGLLERVGLDPAQVGQVVGGCVSQIGEQSFNIARTAWLAAGLPYSVPASTVDAQCGSGQQAFTLAASMVSAGVIDMALACGVESMSRIPIGSNSSGDYGRPVNRDYRRHYEYVSQFEAAERIADRWHISRAGADQFGLLSQQRAARAQASGRFGGQLMTVEVPVLGGDGKPTGETVTVGRDEGPRETTLDGLAGLKPVVQRDNPVHTAGTSSQISDGASAVLLTTESKASELGLTPRAIVRDSVLVGVDPELMLTGPIDATRQLLERNRLSMSDLDVVEINEAFASVVLAWASELKTDLEHVNPNGGAIALGHPLGATGPILVTKAVAELERTGGRYALVTMCCGGGLGTGTLLERC
jgi:acetyl-CoA C-acetyltransferase